MANSYNVNALPDYVDQNRDKLIAKTVLSGDSVKFFNLITGAKGKTALNLIDTEVEFGDGSTCGWNEAGTTSLSQAILNARPVKVNMAICDKNLLDKWAAYKVRVEAGKTDRDLPFEEEFIDGVIKGIKAKIEQEIWSYGASATEDAASSPDYQSDPVINQNLIDTSVLNQIRIYNFENQLDNSVDAATDPNTGGTIIHSAVNNIVGTGGALTTPAHTAYEFIKSMFFGRIGAGNRQSEYNKAELLAYDDTVVFTDMATYNAYIQDLVTLNLYHYNPANGENEYKLPGTNVRVIGVNGLNNYKDLMGTSSFVTEAIGFAFAVRLSNLFYGTNMEDGEEQFDLWYSKDNREFRFASEFTFGSAVAFPEETWTAIWVNKTLS